MKDAVEKILTSHGATQWLRVEVKPVIQPKFTQETPGRPGPNTRYRKEVKPRFDIRYEVHVENVEDATDHLLPCAPRPGSRRTRAAPCDEVRRHNVAAPLSRESGMQGAESTLRGMNERTKTRRKRDRNPRKVGKSLGNCQWIRDRLHVLITGKTGLEKANLLRLWHTERASRATVRDCLWVLGGSSEACVGNSEESGCHTLRFP